MRILLVLLATAALADPARAESPLATKREVPVVATVGELDILRTVGTPPAATAVVNDVAGVLAVGLKPKLLTVKEKAAGVKIVNGPHILLFRLDAQGEARVTPATPVTLPLPPTFTERQNYPLSLAAHPKLPLLYVWQDVQPPGEGSPADDVKSDGFQHLHVYDISSAEPKLVQSVAQGDSFSRGNWGGAIAFDRTLTRLFVPNMQRRVAAALAPVIGYLRVLEDGMIVPNEEEAAELAVGGKGTTADRTGAVTLAARKAYLEQVRTGKVPERAVRYATAATSTFSSFPCGLGFANFSDTVTVICGPLGPVTWDEGNRRAQFNTIVFYPVVAAGYQYRMIAHPTLPVMFLTGVSSTYVYRMEHVDGFLTMLPQRGTLVGATALMSPPVLLGKRNVLACGSAGLLHLVGFDEQGRFNGQCTDVKIAALRVDTLAYSTRFDRLYVAVDEVKK